MVLTALLLSLCGDVSGSGGQVRLFAQADAPIRAHVSTEQLEADLTAVMRMRLSIGLPVALLIAGGVSAAIGGLFIGLGAATSLALLFDNPLVITGLVFLVIGLPFMAVGVWMLSDRLELRKRVNQVSDELRRELYERRRWSSQTDAAPTRTAMTTLATF